MPSAKKPTRVGRPGTAAAFDGRAIVLMASVHVVPELRLGPEVLLEPKDLLVREHPADLAVGIQEVAEHARARRASLDTRRVPALARPLDAEGALLDHAPFPEPVPEVVLLGVHLVGGNDGIAPVEATRVVRAGRDAVAASDAPVVVDHDDAVRLHPGGPDGTDVHAGRVLAVEALRAHVEVPGGGDLVEEVVLGAAEVHFPLLELVNADVLDGRAPVLIVLPHAAADTVHVPAALRDVEGIPVQDGGPRPFRAHLDLLAGAELVEPLEPLHGLRLLLVRHQPEVALKVFLPAEHRLLSGLGRRQRVARALDETEAGQEPRRNALHRGAPVDLTLEELAKAGEVWILAGVQAGRGRRRRGELSDALESAVGAARTPPTDGGVAGLNHGKLLLERHFGLRATAGHRVSHSG